MLFSLIYCWCIPVDLVAHVLAMQASDEKSSLEINNGIAQRKKDLRSNSLGVIFGTKPNVWKGMKV